MHPPLILVTNDDGYRADGIAALAESVDDLGEVWVVAPHDQQSAMSHALTLGAPLRVHDHGDRWFSVTGTPTDSVFLAILHQLPRKPAVVLSGINHGPNLADDVSYSGTVSAALEGAIMGIPGLAFSHVGLGARDWRDGQAIAHELTRVVLDRGLPKRHYLSVNFPDVPAGQCKGLRVAPLGHRRYDDQIVVAEDPRGQPYFWIGGSQAEHTDIPGSDCNLVDEGWATVTALHADPTSVEGNDLLRAWGIENP